MKCMRARGSDGLWCWWCVGQRADFKHRVTTCKSFSDDMLHTGVIVLTRSTSEWLVTSVLS